MQVGEQEMKTIVQTQHTQRRPLISSWVSSYISTWSESVRSKTPEIYPWPIPTGGGVMGMMENDLYRRGDPVKTPSLFLVQLPAVTPLSQTICTPILEVPELSCLAITCKPIFCLLQ